MTLEVRKDTVHTSGPQRKQCREGCAAIHWNQKNVFSLIPVYVSLYSHVRVSFFWLRFGLQCSVSSSIKVATSFSKKVVLKVKEA
jgi:hypothetical protein